MRKLICTCMAAVVLMGLGMGDRAEAASHKSNNQVGITIEAKGVKVTAKHHDSRPGHVWCGWHDRYHKEPCKRMKKHFEETRRHNPPPQHGGPQHGGPQHGGPQHGGPQHGGPQHGGPRP